MVVKPRSAMSAGSQVIMRYILDQRNGLEVLSRIKDLFGFGFVSLRASTDNVYRYTHKTFTGMGPVLQYFSNFPLHSKKAQSFVI